jgi:hypothetical protein
VLAVLVAVFAALPASPLTAVLVAIFVGLLAVELDRSGRHIALRLVSAACRLLPVLVRSDMEAEWRDHVLSAGEAGTRPLLAALSIALWAAPRMAFSHHIRIRAAVRVIGLSATQSDLVDAARERRRRASIMVAALPAVTLLYLTCGRRAARCPLFLLAVVGTAAWVGNVHDLHQWICHPHDPVGWRTSIASGTRPRRGRGLALLTACRGRMRVSSFRVLPAFVAT